jgi:putative flippase GtrA
VRARNSSLNFMLGFVEKSRKKFCQRKRDQGSERWEEKNVRFMCTSITRIIYSCRRLTKQPRSSSFMPPKILSLFRRIVVRRGWRRGAGMKWQKKGENDRSRKERGCAARERARRDHYIKRPITINSEDAVYRGGTRKGINPRGLSADTVAIMKRIGFLSVPEVRLPKVQSSMTATKISLRTSFVIAIRGSFDTRRWMRLRDFVRCHFLTFRTTRIIISKQLGTEISVYLSSMWKVSKCFWKFCQIAHCLFWNSKFAFN